MIWKNKFSWKFWCAPYKIKSRAPILRIHPELNAYFCGWLRRGYKTGNFFVQHLFIPHTPSYTVYGYEGYLEQYPDQITKVLMGAHFEVERHQDGIYRRIGNAFFDLADQNKDG